MVKFIASVFISISLALTGVSTALAEKRIALVVGNSAYEHTTSLKNPKNDASAIADVLTRMGFDAVTLKLDLGYRAMRQAIRAFGRDVRDADLAVMYFAGHGMELAGHNYLVPTDARLLSDSDLEYEAVQLRSVLRAVQSAAKLSLVILDACRNNPLSSSMTHSSGLTRSVTRGFSRIEPTGNTLVAYAAKDGTVSEDGAGTHSPYALALLGHLETPGLEIRLLLGRVRDEVLEQTDKRQEPFVYGSVGGDPVYLIEPADETTTPVTGPKGSDAQAWTAIQNTNSPGVLKAYIKRFPDSLYAEFAKARLAELEAKNEKTEVAVGVFSRYPDAGS